ncbi:hypothetical protein pb186bvf_001657 [Paramecium bursaria]
MILQFQLNTHLQKKGCFIILLIYKRIDFIDIVSKFYQILIYDRQFIFYILSQFMSSNQWLEVTVYDPYGNNPAIELNCQMWNSIKDVKEKLHQQQLLKGKRMIKPEDMIVTDLGRNIKQVQYDGTKLSDLFNQSLVRSESLQVFSSQELISIYYEQERLKVQQLQKEQKEQFEKNQPILKQSNQTYYSTQIPESLIQQSQEEVEDYERLQSQQSIFPENQYCKSCQQRISKSISPTHPQSQQNMKTQNEKDNFQNK